MKQIVIGLAGPKQAGKSTVARMIVEGFNGVDVAIADRLKLNTSIIFDIPIRNFLDVVLKETDFESPIKLETRHIDKLVEIYGKPLNQIEIPTDKEFVKPRDMLQYMGTEVLRGMYGQDVHIQGIPLKENKVNVVTDVRFHNEIDFIKAGIEGFETHTIYVLRDEAEEQAKQATHRSELEPLELREKCDLVLDNNGSFMETEKTIFDYIVRISKNNG